MPQQQGFYDHMTAQTFLYYIADLKGLTKKEAVKEIDMLLDVTNLSPWKRAILCMRPELSAIHADNYIVPILTI